MAISGFNYKEKKVNYFEIKITERGLHLCSLFPHVVGTAYISNIAGILSVFRLDDALRYVIYCFDIVYDRQTLRLTAPLIKKDEQNHVSY